MNFLKYILHGFSRQKVRTILAVLSILFTFTTMITISLFFSSAQATDLEVIERNIAFDIEVKKASHSDMDPDLLVVEDVLPDLEGRSGVTGIYPIIRGFGYTEEGGMPTHFMQIFGAKEELQIGHLSSSQGSYDLTPGGCVISSETALSLGDANGRIDPGDHITINIVTPTGIVKADLVVNGIFDVTGRFQQDSGFYRSPSIILDLDYLQNITGNIGKATHVIVTVDRGLYDLSNPTDPAKKVERIALSMAGDLGKDYEVTTPKGMAIEGGNTNFLSSLSYLFAILFPAISGILVSSVMNLSVEDRTKEFATLRLLGGRRTFIGKVVLLELGVILAAGIVPALLLGSLLAKGIVLLFGLDLDIVSIRVSTQLLLQLLIAVVITVLFSISPIIRALKTSPGESISRVKSAGTFKFVSTERVDRKLVVSGWLVFGALMVAIISVIFLIRSPGNDAICFGSIGLLTILPVSLSIGLLGGITFLEDALVRLFYPVTVRTNKIIRSYIKRNVRRNISTNLIFGTTVAMLIMFSTLFSSLIGSTSDQVRMGVGSDIRIYLNEDGFGYEELDPIANMEGVDHISSVSGPRFMDISDLISTNDATAWAFGIDRNFTDSIYASGMKISEGERSDLDDLADDEIAISKSLAKEMELKKGDRISVEFDSKGDGSNREFFKIAVVISQLPGFIGLFTDTQKGDFGGVLFSHEGYERLLSDGEDITFTSIFIDVNKANKDHVVDLLGERFGSSNNVFIVDTDGLILLMNIQLIALNAVMGVITTILLIVAIFSLVINLYASIKEREYEIGVLKSVGLRNFEVLKALLSEGVVIAVASMFLGVVAGAA
ncbi:MAG: FtsX-like permease family protein, partial [Candidatus Thermoplasmatota archaeon]|nr:FtsX-like permease family protein [Candidatus Thermoplasmatota archaeon]